MSLVRAALVALALLAALPPALAALPLAAGHVSVVDFAFVDSQTGRSLTVAPAGPVAFSFDGGCHSVTATDGSFDSRILCDGATFAPTLATGVHRYFCKLHPSMTGEIVVTT